MDRKSLVKITKELFISRATDRTFKLWDIKKKQLTKSFGDYLDLTNVCSTIMNWNENKVIAGYSNGKIRVWDLQTANYLKEI